MQSAVPDSLVAGVRVWPGPPQADATLARMKEIVDVEYEQPDLVQVAVSIAQREPEKDDAAITRGIMAWLRAHTRYVNDPINQQLLKSPVLMLELIKRDGIAGGDCVDIAMLAACLALAVGIPACLVAEAYDEVHAELVHVYTIVQTAPGTWWNLDTQRTVDEPDTRAVKRVFVSLPDEGGAGVMAYSSRNARHVGAWYNSWDDLWGDVQDIGKRLIVGGRSAQQAGTAVSNAGANAQGLTTARIDLNTVLLIGIGGLLLVELFNRPRR